MTPLILGVRHHSPACARRVRRHIMRLRPALVLIEGPVDFNGRVDELLLPHRLPLAIYSYLCAPGMRRGSWSPFAEHSPEWQAILAADAVGADCRFIDLPAWHPAFAELENRYADALDEEAEAAVRAYDLALERRLCLDGHDALWDALFEDQAGEDADEQAQEALDTAFETYFDHLRGDAPGSLGNRAREEMMAAWIAWAMAQKSGPVVVVCGGYHAPALKRLWPAYPGEQPQVPLPEGHAAGELRYGSFLVPYTFKRLDSFTGYASGMPSPAYYQWLWQGGPSHAGKEMLQRLAARMRNKKLPASTADLIHIHARADGLARLRGHRNVLRMDWLDAIAGGLVKDGLQVPLPWSYRGRLLAGTDPVLVELMDLLAGDAVGTLAPATPQPPLVQAVIQALREHGLDKPGQYEFNLHDINERLKSRLLHQLDILAIPGFRKRGSPQGGPADETCERWQFSHCVESHAALIEAAAWGATVESAAAACLESQLDKAGSDMQRLAVLLDRAAKAGLSSLGDRCLEGLRLAVAEAAKLEPLGKAMDAVYTLFRHGRLYDMCGAPLLAAVLESAYDRALWLFEMPGTVLSSEYDQHILSVKTLVRMAADALRDPKAEEALLPREEAWRAAAVFRRKAMHAAAAPTSRGAALGGLLALTQGEMATGSQCIALLQGLRPGELGDALAGMLALAREQLTGDMSFMAALNQVVADLDDHDFLLALPAMRGAFAWLPARERGALAEALLQILGFSHLSPRTLTADLPPVDPVRMAAAVAAEQSAKAGLALWGIAFNQAEKPEWN